MDVLLILAVAIAMAVGILGTIFPFVPGLPIVWGAALVYGLVEGFGAIAWVCFATITVLFAGGMAAGVLLPKRRLDAAGAPRSTMAAGLALGIIGFFVVPVVGLPLGAALGVWLAERSRLGDSSAAWASTRSLLIGFGTGALAQLGAGFAMAFTWALWVIAA
jgi:uncharacterized protein YqgC (DUF456 family)